ncbi:MAG: nucleotidyltransferase domain-containing protein [Candidatus Hodarchaeales archaeon]|jgi:predicted nucleotidyltransferase
MPKEKIIQNVEREFHHYSKEEITSLEILRNKAETILDKMEQSNIHGFVHGSVARGDITTNSDIDIHIPYLLPSFRLEIIDNYQYTTRYIIMGTPNSTIKGIIDLDPQISITFPLTKEKEREEEFYRFSGKISLNELRADKRVPGVTKQLILIEPMEKGYWISSVIANRTRSLRALKISQRILDERIRVLNRRNNIGRTGIYLKHMLSPEENFEQALHKLKSQNPVIRNFIKKSKK